MIKKDVVAMLKNMKRTKQSFIAGFFESESSESLYPEIVFYSEDLNMFAYSEKPTKGVEASFIFGADDIEYADDSLKGVDSNEDVYFRLEEDEVVMSSMERTFYRAKVESSDVAIPVNKTEIIASESAAALKNSIRLVNSFVDSKGFEQVPYLYLLAGKGLTLYSVSPWVFSMFKIDIEYKFEKEHTYKITPSDITELVRYIPGGKNTTVETSLLSGNLTFIFQNCEILVKGEKVNPHTFLDMFTSMDYENKFVLNTDKLKSMLNKMTGVLFEMSGDFIRIKKENENFAVVENVPLREDRELFSFKVPLVEYELTEDDYAFKLYGKYIKESASKINTENVIVLSNERVTKILSDDERLMVLSMSKREE